jgi:hypothetical protein
MTEGQSDRMTDRIKTICTPISDIGGIKMNVLRLHIIDILFLFRTNCMLSDDKTLNFMLTIDMLFVCKTYCMLSDDKTLNFTLIDH